MSKPNRQPDYISDLGVLFYFEEMIRIAGDRTDYLERDKVDGLLIKKVEKPYKDKCARCMSGSVCERYVLNEHVQKAYYDHMHGAFEKAFGIADEQ